MFCSSIFLYVDFCYYILYVVYAKFCCHVVILILIINIIYKNHHKT